VRRDLRFIPHEMPCPGAGKTSLFFARMPLSKRLDRFPFRSAIKSATAWN